MKKLNRLLFTAAVMLLLNLCAAADVRAEVYDGYVRLTEEERYDSNYFKPLDGELSVDAVGADTDALESAVVAGLSSHKSEIDIRKYRVSRDDFKTFYFRLLNSYAELFYVQSELVYTYDGSGCVLTVTPSYLMTAAEAKQGLLEMDEAAEQALALVSEEMEDYEKALIVHDWLAVHCEYDYERLTADELPEISHSAYGALVNKIAVCDGYSQAYQYIMKNKLGIPCILTSSSSMGHAWNLLRLEDKYYHVDVTWDDPCWDSIGKAYHNNFLLSDTGITGTNHYGWDASVTADDASFEAALWDTVNGSMIYYKGTWYYVDNGSGSLLKTDNLLSGTVTELFSFHDEWRASATAYYPGSASYPQMYKKKLVFNGPKQIYAMSLLTEEIETVYTPSEEELPADTDSLVYNIYGFKMVGSTMYYAVQTTPNLSSAQSSFIHTAVFVTAPISGEVTIEGEARYGNTLTANAQPDEGITGPLTYQWYRGGEKITGADTPQYLLTAEDVGSVISVAVTQDDYDGELRAASSTVGKAVPERPSESVSVTCQLGRPLSCAALPAGYAWADGSVIMDTAGAFTYPASYCPDTAVYEEIEAIMISVTVACFEHEWQETALIKAATCTEPGEHECVCSLCGFSETLEIPAAGHSWKENAVIQEPTAAEAGRMSYICTLCGATKEETIPALGGSSTETPAAGGAGTETPATGGAGAETPVTGGAGTETPAAGSSGAGASAAEAPAKGTVLAYKKAYYKITRSGASGGTVEFLKPSVKAKSLTIPATISVDNVVYRVTSIAAKACKGNTKLTKVTVGANVTSIGKEAFSGCKKLKTITIKSAKLTSVGKNAVKNIKKNAVLRCPPKKVKAYKKLFNSKSGYKKTMKIK